MAEIAVPVILTDGGEAFADAVALQAEAAREGFDWPDAASVLSKVIEEIGELASAATTAERAEELGDLLFVLANWARHHGLNPETCLRDASRKFQRRYAHVRRFMDEYPPAGPARLAAMDARWDEAKQIERQGIDPVSSAAGL